MTATTIFFWLIAALRFSARGEAPKSNTQPPHAHPPIPQKMVQP